MTETYASPRGAPPSHNPFTNPSASSSSSAPQPTTTSPTTTYEAPSHPPPSRSDTLGLGVDADGVPDEPPPAYSTVAGEGEGAGDVTLAAGPTHVDFSGPPPMPDRLLSHATGGGMPGQWYPQGQGPMGAVPTGGMGPTPTGGMGIPGVGYGYGSGGQGQGMSQQFTGASMGPQYTGAGGNTWAPSPVQSPPPPPPRHPSVPGGSGGGGGFASPTGPPPGSKPGMNGSRPSGQQASPTPTEAPTPGRPLLRQGQLLVYPKGYMCSKCQNTGYKAADPSNPCQSDWRKYGKPYNSALAHSYSITPVAGANASTSASTNFQRPLPNLHGPASSSFSPSPQPSPVGNHGYPGSSSGPSNAYSHLPPPPGAGGWNAYPGQHHDPSPSPRPQQVFIQHTPAMPPPGALVVGPGDPRIGGRLCYRCSGSGRESSFFGFDDGPCWQCGGTGRVF